MPPFLASVIRRSRSDAFSPSVAVFRFSPATSYIRSIGVLFLQCAAVIPLHVATLIIRYVERAEICGPPRSRQAC
jgi:hypothetical protein